MGTIELKANDKFWAAGWRASYDQAPLQIVLSQYDKGFAKGLPIDWYRRHDIAAGHQACTYHWDKARRGEIV